MDLNHVPQSTFRPIRDSFDSSSQGAATCTTAAQAKVTSPSTTAVTVTSPPLKSSQKLLKSWRQQGSDTWSSCSRQSSRPGSSAQPGSRPPSTNHLYCKSGNSSTSDVSVARNFQQLSVSSRRAAFKTQKWSHSFDQSCVTSPVVPKRRQTSLQQQKSLDLDSGYLGSPASGLISSNHSQTWGTAESTQQLIQSPLLSPPLSCLPDNVNDACGGSLGIETARLELAELICSQETDAYNRNLSLPAFCQTFSGSSTKEDNYDNFFSSSVLDPVAAMEEADALDEEIKQIVGDITAHDDDDEEVTKSPFSQSINSCLKPTPIRSNTIIFSPQIVTTTPEDSSFVPDEIMTNSVECDNVQGCQQQKFSYQLTPPEVSISETGSSTQSAILCCSISGRSKDTSSGPSQGGQTRSYANLASALNKNQEEEEQIRNIHVAHPGSIQHPTIHIPELSTRSTGGTSKVRPKMCRTTSIVSPDFTGAANNTAEDRIMLAAVVSTIYQTYDVPRSMSSSTIVTSHLTSPLGCNPGTGQIPQVGVSVVKDSKTDNSDLNFSPTLKHCLTSGGKRNSSSSCDTMNSTLNNSSNNSVRNLLAGSPNLLAGSTSSIHSVKSDMTGLTSCSGNRSTSDLTGLTSCAGGTRSSSLKLDKLPSSGCETSFQSPGVGAGSESPAFVFKKTAQFSGEYY